MVGGQDTELPRGGELGDLDPLQEGRLAGAVRTYYQDGKVGWAEVRAVDSGGQTKHFFLTDTAVEMAMEWEAKK